MCLGRHTKGSSFSLFQNGDMSPVDTAHFGRWHPVFCHFFGFTCNSPQLFYSWISYLLSDTAFLQLTCICLYGSSILFLLLSSFVLMSALDGLELQILNPGGHLEQMLPESGRTGWALLLVAFLENFHFSAPPASSSSLGLSVG